MWIRRFFCSTHHPWKTIFTENLAIVGGEKILLNQSLDTVAINRSNLDNSTKSILTAWGNYIKTDMNEENILSQQLFLNCHIKIKVIY